MKYLIFIFSAVCFLNIRAQGFKGGGFEPVRSDSALSKLLGKEIVSKRTLCSKTFLNEKDNTLTAVVSSGYLHYMDKGGRLQEIERNIRLTNDSTAYGASQGLYSVGFGFDNTTPITFRLQDSTYYQAKTVQLALYDKINQKMIPLESAQKSRGKVKENKIQYNDLFTGIDMVYEYRDTELKQWIYINQKGREKLIIPNQYRKKLDRIYLVVVSEFEVSDTLEAYVGDACISEKQKGKKKLNIEHEGKENVVFRGKNNKHKFTLPGDVAFASLGGRSEVKKQDFQEIMWRKFYVSNENNYVFTGISVEWFFNQPEGTVVLDPTVSIESAIEDVYIYENHGNTGGSAQLLRIGSGFANSEKRALLKFDLREIVPTDAVILSSEMNLYFYDHQAPGGSPIPIYVQCHEVFRDWDESEASWICATASENWDTPGLNFVNRLDANPSPEDYNEWDDDFGWKTFNLLTATQKWVTHPEFNFGVILKKANGSPDGDEKLCRSSEYTGDVTQRPYMEITYQAFPLAEYTYDAAGRPTTVNYANGMIEETNQYDSNRDWIIRRDYKKDGDNLFYFHNSGYDLVGNVMQQQYKHYTESVKTLDFTYDDLYRLKETKYNSTVDRSYTYDPNGNLLTFAGRNFNYGNNNNQMTYDGIQNYVYDLAGRVKQRDSDPITYDIFNNMTEYGNDTYSYDADGQRLMKKEGEKKTYYYTSGGQILAEYYEQSKLSAEYIYGPNGMIAQIDPEDGFFWFCKDHLGSTRALINNDGSPVMKREYFAYGQTRTAAGDETGYRFSGKELDSNTELYYSIKRYLDPAIGGWFTPDPISVLRPMVSPYVYCGDNPINRIDPFGLDWIPHRDEEENLLYYEWDEPLICRASDNSWWQGWGAEYGSPLGSTNDRGLGLRVESRPWYQRPTQLAYPDDPWYWKGVRGTGNLRQDMDSFVIGVTTISVVTVVGGCTVITVGPTVVGWITTTGTAIYWGLGSAYASLNIYGNYYLGIGWDKTVLFAYRSWNFIQNIGYQTANIYLANKPAFDAFGRGFISGLYPYPPDPERSLYYWIGWGITSNVRK